MSTLTSKFESTKVRILAVLLFAVMTVTAGAGSLALLTDRAIVNMPQQVETIVITANNSHSLNIPLKTWREAGSEKNYQPIVLKNDGNGELRFSVASATSGNAALNAALEVSAKFNSDPTRCTAAEWGGLGANGPSSVTPETFDIGDPAQGNQAGDRLLPPGGESMMCIETKYISPVTDGAVMTWTADINAEQTFNNP